MQECRGSVGDKVQNTFCNILHATDGVCSMEDDLYVGSIKQLLDGGKTNCANVYVVCLAVMLDDSSERLHHLQQNFTIDNDVC
ncbi:hypothetical protein Tco_0381993 [Tanacetum coccineum]